MDDRIDGSFVRRWGLGLACLAGCAWAAGCASPGVPQPPSLKLPEPAKGVKAERVGDVVRLRWTTPAVTTDGDTVKGKIVAVVCREETVPGRCLPVDQREVTPGASATEVKLAGGLAEGPARLLGFRVDLRNAKGRSAGATQPVFVAGGKAPGIVETFGVTAIREGALLRWQRLQDGAVVEVRREPAEVTAGAPVFAKSSSFGEKKDKGDAVVLRAGNTDSGGMVDREVARSVQYRYTAQRVLLVKIAGKDLALRGPESAAVVWTFNDVFPPAVPTGLVAVPGPDSIDLSWDVGLEADLAGYFVLRQAGNGPERKLNGELVVGPAFRDMTAVKGTTYKYRVTAVDKRGNESQPSADVRETLR